MPDYYIQNARLIDNEIVSIQAKINQAIRQLRIDVVPKVVRYEEIDDEYRAKAHAFYLKYVSQESIQEDLRLEQIESNNHYVLGALRRLWDMGSGLVSFIWNGLRYSSAIEAGVEPPDDVYDHVISAVDSMQRIIDDPRLIYEDPIKDFTDMFDEDPAYALGYVTPDIIMTIISLYQAYKSLIAFLEKQGLLDDVGGLASHVDDGFDVADDIARHLDDSLDGSDEIIRHLDDGMDVADDVVKKYNVADDIRRIPDEYRDLDFTMTGDEFLNEFVDPKYHDTVREAFGEYWDNVRVTRITKDLAAYRYYGGKADAAGHYFVPSKVDDPVSLLALPEGNTAELIAEVTIPEGSVVLEGRVAPLNNQPGGGFQIYSPDKLYPN